VSERAVQVGIARTRAGAVTGPDTAPGLAAAEAGPDVGARTEVTETTVFDALAEVMDPELPMVSIVELGMIGSVTVGRTIEIALLPTYVGCPAIEMIRSAVEHRLAAFGRPVEVVSRFEIPWTSDRITPAGLAALATAGIAPPRSPADTRCPYCASEHVALDSVFGPTQCRSLFYCRDCRQPFEAIKPV